MSEKLEGAERVAEVGQDTEMGDLRITAEPLGLTNRPRSAAEIAAVARPVVPPAGAGATAP